MSYAEIDASREDGQPYTLFLIVYGDDPENYFAYTDSDRLVTREGVAYLPTVIGRQKIESSGNLDRKTLEIDISPNASVVQFYRDRTPPGAVSLTIWQGHHTDATSEARVIWKGRILSLEQKRPFCKINAEPLSTTLRRAGLRRNYQRGCPHVLYSTGFGECKADKEQHKVVLNPLVVGQNFLEVPEDFSGDIPFGKYISGYLQWQNDDDNATETRTIIRSSLNGSNRQLILNGTASGMSLTTSVSLYVGCNHRRSDCADLHNNIVNFGGQYAIPRQNPFGYVNRFY